MKIYQLHECGGEYEDYFDHIIGSYMRKERAEEEKLKAEQEELARQERHRKCCSCPLLDRDLQMNTLNYIKYVCGNYCSNAQIYADGFGYDCENYESNWDDSSFRIDEIEVEE